VLKNIYYKNLNYQIKNIHLSFKWANIKKLIILGLRDIKIIRNITTLIEKNITFNDTKKKNKSFGDTKKIFLPLIYHAGFYGNFLISMMLLNLLNRKEILKF
jgi:hypothetical protein